MNQFSERGKVHPLLKGAPSLPYGTQHVWDWFLKLTRKRPVGFGLGEIPETEMESFFRLRGIVPLWWELEALSELDRAYIQNNSELQEEKASQRSKAKAKAKPTKGKNQ